MKHLRRRMKTNLWFFKSESKDQTNTKTVAKDKKVRFQFSDKHFYHINTKIKTTPNHEYVVLTDISKIETKFVLL